MENQLIDSAQTNDLIKAFEQENFDHALALLLQSESHTINPDIATIALHKVISTIVHNQPKNFLEIIELLLKHGARVNDVDNCGDTALTRLLYFTTQPLYENHLQAVELLLKHRADVHHISQNSNLTCLMLAVHNSDMLKLLLKYGADLNQRNPNGQTVLMLAAEYDNLEIIKFLLDNGADSTIKDTNGQSIIAYAISDELSVKRYKFLQFLLKHPKNLSVQDHAYAQDAFKALQNIEEKDHVKVIELTDCYKIYDLFEVDGLDELIAKFRSLAKDNKDLVELLNTDIRDIQTLPYDNLYPVYAKDVMLLLFTMYREVTLTDILFLLQNNACVNVQFQHNGQTALANIIKLISHDETITYKKIMEELLIHGANPNIKDNASL